MSLRVETFVVGPLTNNLYLLIDDEARECVVIDPSVQSEPAVARVQQLQATGIRPTAIWNTHGHFDHIYDNAAWRAAFDVPLLMHPDDAFMIERLPEYAQWLRMPAPQTGQPDGWIEAGSTLSVGNHHAYVLHTPGHSPGSVSFCFPGLCISGDVLFRGSVGRTDLPGCSQPQLFESLRLLCELPAETRILPGHGDETTIGAELETNPFCRNIFSRENSLT